MRYQLTCTCGATHAIAKSQAGQSMTCSCGQNLEIPTLRGLEALPKLEESAVGSAKSPSQSSERARPAVLSGVMYLGSFVALCSLIFFAYNRLQLDTSQSEESERKAAFDAIDGASPTALSDAWAQYSSTALGPPTKPPFYYIDRRRRWLEQGIIGSAAALVLSGAGAAISTAARRKAKE